MEPPNAHIACGNVLTRCCRCQKDHWSKHKSFCNLAQGKGSKKAYLTSYEHDEVLRVLIDTYRMRVDTDHSAREEDHGIYYPGKSIDGLVWAKGDGRSHSLRLISLKCRFTPFETTDTV